jgi:hypothetical protein
VRHAHPLTLLDREMVEDFEALSPVTVARPAVLELRGDCVKTLAQIRGPQSADARRSRG